MKLERELGCFKYVNQSEDYQIKKKAFEYQYAPLYAERLVIMRNQVSKAALNKWGDSYQIKGLVQLEKHEKSIIIGTLYKEMKNKPNILKELAEDENNTFAIQPVLNRDKYTDPSDELILEDELQRIVLIDPENNKSNIIKENRFCTGLVIALLGYENEESKFVVEDYCFKETPYASSSTSLKSLDNLKNIINDDKYIVFLSGIELGDTETNKNLYRIQMFIDFLSGDFMEDVKDSKENETKLNTLLTKSFKLIIAGNSLASNTQSKDMHRQAKYLTKNYVAASVSSIKQLDDFLLQLTSKIDIDLMPGEFDPTNFMVPQQPLHHAMFTKTKSNKSTFRTVTNPYRFKLDDICFLGTSGQFIDDIRRSTNVDDSIELMKLTLEAGHLGPTCPDTLACYPYYGKDPFVLNELPHVYFCGNQRKFQHDIYTDKNKNKIHLLSLPKFSSTFSCIFFNLRTFESEQIFF